METSESQNPVYHYTGVAYATTDSANLQHLVDDAEILAAIANDADTKSIIELIVSVAKVKTRKSDLPSAIIYFGKAKELAEIAGLVEQAALMNMFEGICYQRMRMMPIAIEKFLQSLGMIDEEGTNTREVKLTRAKILENLAIVYGIEDQFDLARKYLQSALAIIEEEGFDERLHGVYLNLGNAFQGLNQYTEALDCFKKSAFEYSRRNNGGESVYLLNNIALTLNSKGEYNAAHNTLLHAVEYAESLKDREGLLLSFRNLAALFGSEDWEHYSVAQSTEYYKRAIAIALDINVPDSLASMYDALAKRYAKQQDWVNASTMQAQRIEVLDIIHEMRLKQGIYEHKNYLDTILKEAESSASVLSVQFAVYEIKQIQKEYFTSSYVTSRMKEILAGIQQLVSVYSSPILISEKHPTEDELDALILEFEQACSVMGVKL